MFNSIKMASSGIKTNEDMMQFLSANAVNINSKGFAERRFAVGDLDHRKQISSNNSLERGLGTKVSNAYSIFKQGDLERTDVYTHYAICGDGFFKLIDPKTGAEYYTRAGDFKEIKDTEDTKKIESDNDLEDAEDIESSESTKNTENIKGTQKVKNTENSEDAEKSTYYLGTIDGLLVASSTGKKIKWDPDDRQKKLDVGIYKVAQNEKMQEIGDCRYKYEGTDKPQFNNEATLEQKCLENSNVDTIDMLVGFAKAKRLHEINAKMINISSDALEEIISLPE